AAQRPLRRAEWSLRREHYRLDGGADSVYRVLDTRLQSRLLLTAEFQRSLRHRRAEGYLRQSACLLRGSESEAGFVPGKVPDCTYSRQRFGGDGARFARRIWIRN